MLSLSVSLIWLLALLAASAHVQHGERGMIALLAMVPAFALAFVGGIYLSAQPNWVGVLVGLTAMWQLIDGPLQRAGNLLGAGCAGLAAALQVAGGVPVWLAAALGASALIFAALALKRGPARARVRDAVLIATALAAPIVGLAGDLVYGWHSAAVLNRGAVAEMGVSTPPWAVAVVVLALLGGALRGIWKKR